MWIYQMMTIYRASAGNKPAIEKFVFAERRATELLRVRDSPLKKEKYFNSYVQAVGFISLNIREEIKKTERLLSSQRGKLKRFQKGIRNNVD